MKKISLILLMVLMASHLVFADGEKPLFDGNDGGTKMILKVFTVETLPNPDTGAMDVTLITEYWMNDPKVAKAHRGIRIRRCVCSSVSEALVLPAKGFFISFEAWDNISDVGEKTSWCSDNLVCFTKGAQLVILDVDLPTDRAYVTKIGKLLVSKL